MKNIKNLIISAIDLQKKAIEFQENVTMALHSILGYADSNMQRRSNQKQYNLIIEENSDQLNIQEETMRIGGNLLRKRKSGLWELRITYDGKSKSIYGKTQSIVRGKYAYLMSQSSSKCKKTPTTTVAEWIDKYLLLYKYGKIGIKSYNTLKSMLRRYICVKIGNKAINKITSLELQELFNELEYLGNTKTKLKTYVNDIFRKAFKNNLIKTNVAEDIILSKAKSEPSVALTDKEQQFLINFNHKDEKLKMFYLFCLYSGCRRAEAIKLKLSDIESGLSHIRGTKTSKSDRFIPYFDKIKELLVDVSTDNVFEGLLEDYVSKHFKDILPNHTLRDLRKTFATNCHELGISPKVVQKWLGHTTLDMTMNTYTDVRPSFEQSELDKINSNTQVSTQI